MLPHAVCVIIYKAWGRKYIVASCLALAKLNRNGSDEFKIRARERVALGYSVIHTKAQRSSKGRGRDDGSVMRLGSIASRSGGLVIDRLFDNVSEDLIPQHMHSVRAAHI